MAEGSGNGKVRNVRHGSSRRLAAVLRRRQVSPCFPETPQTGDAGVAARVAAGLHESAATDISPGRLRTQDPTTRSGMRWMMEFYNERRGILARYSIEAPLPAAAILLGRKAVLAEYASTPRRSRLSLFERAERVGGQDASGWVLYRILKDNGQGSTGVAPAHV